MSQGKKNYKWDRTKHESERIFLSLNLTKKFRILYLPKSFIFSLPKSR